MARKRTGTVEAVLNKDGKLDHYKVRITLPDKTRPWIHLPPGTSEAMAHEKAAGLTELAWKKNATYTPKRGPKAVQKPTEPTIKALAAKWLELLDAELKKKAPAISPATVVMHKNNVSNYVEPDLGKYRPEELTTSTLRAWIRGLRDKLAASTVRNIFNSLSKLLDDAIGEEWIALVANPARAPRVRATLPTVEAPESIRHFTQEQAAKLVAAEKTPAERRARYLVAFTTGMRDGELAALRWSSIGVEQGIRGFHVTKNLAQVGPDGHATEKAPKTKAGRRFLPLHHLAEAALDRWREVGWEQYVGRAPKDGDPIFPNEHGAPWRPKSAEYLRADLKAAEMSTTFEGQDHEMNDTRHSFATWLASAGVPKELRDRLMGHAAGSVGERHYTARDVVLLRAAIETIHLGEKPTPKEASPASESSEESSGEETASAISLARPGRFELPTLGSVVLPGTWTLRDCCGGDAGTRSEPSPPSMSTKPAIVGPKTNVEESELDPVEAALAMALGVAARAGDLAAITAITAELRERRQARAGVPGRDQVRTLRARKG